MNLIGTYSTLRRATTAAKAWIDRTGDDKWEHLVVASLPEVDEDAHVHSRREFKMHKMWEFTPSGTVKRSHFRY